jgi:hypothetical protein
MNETMQIMIAALPRYAELNEEQRAALLRGSASARALDDDEADALIAALAEYSGATLKAATTLTTALLEHWAQRARVLARERGPTSFATPTRDHIAKLYNDLRQSPPAAWTLLGALAAGRGRHDLTLLAELLATAPPADAPQMAVALGPLFQRTDYDPAALFPRLLDALVHKHLAGPGLDLANYLMRKELVSAHPAAPRAAELVSLLGALVQRLAQIEESPDAAGRTAQEVGGIVAESLPLAVALCDT